MERYRLVWLRPNHKQRLIVECLLFRGTWSESDSFGKAPNLILICNPDFASRRSGACYFLANLREHAESKQ